MDLSDLHVWRDGCFRPPDWRWRQAQLLFLEKAPLVRNFQPDEQVFRAVRYLEQGRLSAGTGTPAEKCEFDVVTAALKLRDGEALLRAELEARILARQDSPAIAEWTGFSVALVDAYRDLFYDLGPRLDVLSYVMGLILGSEFAPPDANDIPALMKLFAYHGGPHVLDEYLWYLAQPHPAWPKKLARFSPQELEHLKRWALVRLTVLTLTYVPETFSEKLRYLKLRLHRAHWKR